MTSSNRRARIGHKGQIWSSSCWGIALVAALLLAVASLASAGPCSADPRLSATLMGQFEPGARGRIAVRWDGPEGTLLDVWVDLDGDSVLESYELVAEGRSLVPGIEVVSFELPVGVPVVAKPKVWVRARDGGWNDAEATLTGSPSGDGSDGCGWQAGFNTPGLDGPVRAMTVFDDGSGPALYVGGSFETAGDATVNRIARWDGSEWSALSGPSGIGVEGNVLALAVFNDGSGPALFVGGNFDRAGGVWANQIARWDGTAWSALSGPTGVGVDGGVWTLVEFDDGSGPALYVGGHFWSAGGVTVNYIARWDGSEWSDLSGPSGIGVNGSVSEFAVFNDGSEPALYAGGSFETAGGVIVSYIARWRGSEWSALTGPAGTGMGDRWSSVEALAVFDGGSGPALFAGGDFVTAGGVPTNRIARWDGAAWSALDEPPAAGVDNSVRALTTLDHGSAAVLYAGGSFTIAGDVTVNHIARWDGSSWSALSGPNGTGVKSDWGDESVNSLALYDDGTGPALYAAGDFSTAGGVTVNGIGRWDGSAWSALSGPSGIGADGNVYALAVYDEGSGPALFAGGEFATAGGVTANHVARWDGSEWSALGGPSGIGVDGHVYALSVFDDGSGPALYLGGRFTVAGNIVVNHIARWDGSSWSALSGPAGTGMGSSYPPITVVDALAVFDDGSGTALYVGGHFDTAGGETVNHISGWDGSSWTALSGPNGTGVWADMDQTRVFALEAYDDGSGMALYAGGIFYSAGGVIVKGIARWDGFEWSAIGGPTDTGVDGFVSALAFFDDSSGESLYVGGGFRRAGGLLSNNIAAWGCDLDAIFVDGFESGDTSAWSTVTP